MFPVARPKTAMRNTVFIFILSTENQQCDRTATEQGEIHTKINAIGRGPILFDICLANKSETDSNI